MMVIASCGLISTSSFSDTHEYDTDVEENTYEPEEPGMSDHDINLGIICIV